MTIKYVRGTLPGLDGVHDLAVLEGDSHIGAWVEEAGRLDHDQAALPRIGALLTPDDVVYDVGAFIGDHTAYYASCARQVVAFEGLPDAFGCLVYNTHSYRNVHCLHAAVGDGGFVNLVYTDAPNKGARYLVPTTSKHGVATLCIDNLAWTPTFIKLDIEGGEVAALRGAGRILRERRPTLVVEVNRGALERAGTSPAELYEVLTVAGYRDLTDLFTGEAWRPYDPRPQFDVVCR